MTAPVPTQPRRLAYLGNPAIAVAPLLALHEASDRLGMEIVVVATAKDRRRSRRGQPTPTPVGAAAADLGLPVVHDLDAAVDSGADSADRLGGAEDPLDEITRRGVAGAESGSGAGAGSGSGAGSATFFDFLPGSSGCTSRIRPSRSALRRTRSAWASTIPEEWLFTPMPSDPQRSRTSALVIPISRASS